MGEYTEQNPLRLIELFAGIGSQTQALTNIGVPHTVVGISEIDKYAIQSYKAMHGEVTNFGDIREITTGCRLVDIFVPLSGHLGSRQRGRHQGRHQERTAF